MNNNFSLDHLSKTSNLDLNLIPRQYKLHLVARVIEINSVNIKLKQDQIPKELGFPSSTSQQGRHEINMLPPYRISPNSHKRRPKISITNLNDDSRREHDVKRPQKTSKDLERPQMTSKLSSPDIETVKSSRAKKKMRRGGNMEIDVGHLGVIFHKNTL